MSILALQKKEILQLLKDYNHGEIQVFKQQNGTPFKNSVNIPKTVAERLVNRFMTEMDNRSNVLKKYYEVKLLEVLKTQLLSTDTTIYFLKNLIYCY